MELFQDNMIIRLKNGQDRYLIAHRDEISVSKSRDGFTKNAQWTIELNDKESLYLKSCYEKYLTASNQPSIPGMIARNLKIIQNQPVKKNTSHLWLPVGQSDPQEPHSFWLKTLHGSYLKSHSGPPPLGNVITHDLLQQDKLNSQNKKITWHVEIVDSPSDTWKHSDSMMSKMLVGMRSFVSEKHKVKDKNKGDEKDTRNGRGRRMKFSHRLNCKTI
ncbi:uncharacterized protein [Rutidosis leptorrhynchoides]|uniref:uncharacterized protein n=1 Tax=Rutidosis leptorrhynchoides TaxID=125765 RepID=UPI003A996173